MIQSSSSHPDSSYSKLKMQTLDGASNTGHQPGFSIATGAAPAISGNGKSSDEATPKTLPGEPSLSSGDELEDTASSFESLGYAPSLQSWTNDDSYSDRSGNTARRGQGSESLDRMSSPLSRQWMMGQKAFSAVMPHHASIKALWETKWKFPCEKSVYPFHDGAYEDFAPIFDILIDAEEALPQDPRGFGLGTREAWRGAEGGMDPDSPQYTWPFISTARHLEEKADDLARLGQLHDCQASKQKAIDIYLRACAVLRIARFPYILGEAGAKARNAKLSRQFEIAQGNPQLKYVVGRSTRGHEAKWKAWEMQKEIYMKAGLLWEVPCEDVMIPHKYRSEGEGEYVPVYVRVPTPEKDEYQQKQAAESWLATLPRPRGNGTEGELSRPASACLESELSKQELSFISNSTHQFEAAGVDRKQTPPNAERPATAGCDGGAPVASNPYGSTDPLPAPDSDESPIDQEASADDAHDTPVLPRASQVPAVLLLTGLDGYRPDNTVRCNEFLARGWGVVVAEIPGTADCPADPSDPEAGDRVWDSVLNWMEEDGRFDMNRLLAWGLSAGGYHAVRLAHVHRERFLGVVAQGAGTHHFFDPDWIVRAEGHEYPFALAPAMAQKHGYQNVGEYIAQVQSKFSLLNLGTLDMPSTRLLLVNGTKDGLMPIEDSHILFEHGSTKEARFFSDALHMGYPRANEAVYPWMEQVLQTAVPKTC